MMTKKDFERAANIVREARAAYSDHMGDAGKMAWFSMQEAFVCFFRISGNSRFDADRFRQACIPKEQK